MAMSYQQTTTGVKKSPPDTPVGWTEERLAALRSARALAHGSRTLWEIARHTGGRFLPPASAEERTAWPLTDSQKERLAASWREPIEPLAEYLDRHGICAIFADDPGYPAELLRIPDPPYVIFLRGTPLRDEVRIAIVGTRRMTSYGRRSAAFFGGELGRAGITVVSGLATGIDAESHRACIDAGGRAVAVLPGGVDDASVVPRSNMTLVRDILAADGTLASEHLPGTDMKPYSFLYRNRIIAGLSNAVLIVEGDHDSGALVTARLALEQGKEVLAVPGSIWSRASKGPNRLLADGARLCESMQDIWEALGMDGREARRTTQARSGLPPTPAENCILELCGEERTADELARLSGFSAQEVASALSLLELKGRILNVGPKTFLRLP